MRFILYRVRNSLRLISKIGFLSYAKLKFSFNKEVIRISINNNNVWIRKNSTDLQVAIESLSGEFDILKDYIDKAFSGVIIDAGSYIGTATLALRNLYPNAKIICLEPSAKNFQILKKNLSHIKDVKLIFGALVGIKRETVVLKDRMTGDWGFSIASDRIDKSGKSELNKAPAYTISQLGVQIKDIGILKLDIEGGEYELFKDDSKTLEKIPVIFVELHERIVKGTERAFYKFSSNRLIIKDVGEKYLSIRNKLNDIYE